ncbi:MAG: hypothetical protein PVG38_16795 [Gammaproteobacteria bacterium]
MLFTNCVKLLPEILAAGLKGDRLQIHVLDAGSDATAELQRLERAVARVYPQNASFEETLDMSVRVIFCSRPCWWCR